LAVERSAVDARALRDLLEESQDIQSDAMGATREPLAELVELGHERRAGGGFDPVEADQFRVERRRLMRSSLVAGGALAAYGFGGALLRLLETPAFADQALDVQMLQTSASLENLAVATYDTALALPFIGGDGANATVKAFVTTTRGQHADHAKAFNDALTKLGGKLQPGADPVLIDVVNKAKPTLTDAGKVVDLAITLETGATETYQNNVAALADPNAKMVTASIMGVEAQHVAVLLAVQALLKASRPDLINLDPGNVANLPDVAGKVGFPESFQKTDMARAAGEGATK
jgi:ferritin-like protein